MLRFVLSLIKSIPSQHTIVDVVFRLVSHQTHLISPYILEKEQARRLILLPLQTQTSTALPLRIVHRATIPPVIDDQDG